MPRHLVFISYSHKDERWRDALDTHLIPYLRNGSIKSWSDMQINSGSQWFDEIAAALNEVMVAVLLVTPNFLASEFIHEHELGPLLKKAEQGGVIILWVPIRESAYKQTALVNYQSVFSPTKPLAAMALAGRDKAWMKICEEIHSAVNKPLKLVRTRTRDLSERNLNQANLRGANLRQALLSRRDLRGANFRQALLSGEDLRGANLRQTDLSGADLYRADLSEADLGQTNLSQANLGEANLSQTNLREANLREASLRSANLYKADLSEADLGQANLSQANLEEANLGQANLEEANLSQANLGEANLREASLRGANLSRADLRGANLEWADLSTTNLEAADFRGANLSQASLKAANLIRTLLIGTDISHADLTGSSIYGIAVWDVKVSADTRQDNLIITPPGAPVITVDNILVAQSIYLLLHNDSIRDVIDTLTTKNVLILGRFSADRKPILDAIRNGLREYNYLPIVFDFLPSANQGILETIKTLAGMARFVIADLTGARSVLMELAAIVPSFPSLAVRLLIKKSEHEYGMLDFIRKFSSVVKETWEYENEQEVIASIKENIIGPAEEKVKELRAR
jgi:uncharacterized protein YjbI with pentapeptide repeats